MDSKLMIVSCYFKLFKENLRNPASYLLANFAYTGKINNR
jgi:hypothetical protein